MTPSISQFMSQEATETPFMSMEAIYQLTMHEINGPKMDGIIKCWITDSIKVHLFKFSLTRSREYVGEKLVQIGQLDAASNSITGQLWRLNRDIAHAFQRVDFGGVVGTN
jgi:hypothetical protein